MATFEPARKTDWEWERITGGRSSDFNGDGKLDLAFMYADQSYLALGRGNGYFEPAKLVPPAYSSIREVSDFDGDGRSDIIVSENVYPPVSSLLVARADGTFDRRPFTVNVPRGLAADFNGDGKPDLAGNLITVEKYGTNVAVSLNRGDGSFAPAVEYEIGMAANDVNVRAGDVDGDGDLDLIRISDWNEGTAVGGTVLWSYTNTVSVLINKGDGTFQTGPSRYAGIDIMNIAAVADVNGDGKADLACAHHFDIDPFIPQQTIAVLLGNGDGTFGSATFWEAGFSVHSVFAADLNGDGAMDLGITGGVAILLGNRDGTFQRPTVLPLKSQQNWTVVGDFDGDGQTDVATDFMTGVQVFINACHPPPDPNGLWIQRRNQTAVLSWPTVPTGALLEATTNTALTGWSGFLGNVITNQNRLELEALIEGPQRYFRLREPAP